MKHIKYIVAAIGAFVMPVAFASAQATCRVNGQVVPCDQLGKGLVIVPIIIAIIGLLAFIFWLWMLIHSLSKPIEHKVVWVVVLIFTGILGAILYYFLVKRKFVESAIPPVVPPTQMPPTPPTPPTQPTQTM